MQSTKAILRSSRIVSNYCRRLALKQLKTCQCQCASRLCSTTPDVVLPPRVEGQPTKAYPPKIEKIVQDISQLTLLEVADLNELLKKTLNIQDAPMMAMGAVAAPTAPQEEEEEDDEAPQQQQMVFTVKLTKFDAVKKSEIIKAVKRLIPDTNLVQARGLVENTPLVVKTDLLKDEAEQVKEQLTAAGGTVELE